jgi:hypothetical protein
MRTNKGGYFSLMANGDGNLDNVQVLVNHSEVPQILVGLMGSHLE